MRIPNLDGPQGGWIPLQLDSLGQPAKHDCPSKKKKQQEQPNLDNGPQIAELANQVRDLKETVNVLISQIQMLRSEVKNRKCISE